MPSVGSYANNVLMIRDTLMSPAAGITPWGNFPLLAIDCDPGTGFQVSDDFFALNSAATNGLWLPTKGTGGTLALSSTAGTTSGGWCQIPTAASANDYQILSTQQPVFTLQNNMDMCFEASVNVTEAATNAASWFAGFTSTITTGFLQNSGAPAANFSGVVLWKATGALLVKCMTSNATTQSSSATLATAVSATTLIVGAYINHNDNVTAIVTPYIGTVAANVRTLVGIGASQNLTMASLVNMYFAYGVRAGAGGTAETIKLDYVRAAQGRFYQ